MKVSVLCLLYFVVGTAIMVLCFSFATTSILSISDAVFIDRMVGMKMTAISRKLKENNYNNRSIERSSDSQNMNVEDYNPIDPVPSSKASIKPGPIEHGTPLNPYIPKRSPPPPSRAQPKKFAQLP